MKEYTFSVGNSTSSEKTFHHLQKIMPRILPKSMESENPRYAVYQYAEFHIAEALNNYDDSLLQFKITVSPGENTTSETYEIEVSRMGMEFVE